MEERRTSTTKVRNVKTAIVQITCPSCGKSYNEQLGINIAHIEDMGMEIVQCAFCGEWSCFPRTLELFSEESSETRKTEVPAEAYADLSKEEREFYSHYGVALRNRYNHMMYRCPECNGVSELSLFEKTSVSGIRSCPKCGKDAYFPATPVDWE